MKNKKEMDLKELTQFFSVLSDDNFFSNEQNDWLWNKVNIIGYLMKARGVDKLNFAALEVIVKSKDNVGLIKGCDIPMVLESAKNLDEALTVMVDPVQIKMETIVLAEWEHYLTKDDSEKMKKEKEKFSFNHLAAVANYVFGAALLFSLIFFFTDNAGLWSFVQLIAGFAGLWILKKMFFKAKNLMQEKAIEKTLTFSEAEKTNSENKYYQDISEVFSRDMKETNWTSDEDVNAALRTLKSQTIKLALLLDKKEKIGIDVVEPWYYIETIWKKHIPLLLSNSGDTPDKNKILRSTILAMQKVLQSHIEDMVYSENVELSAKQKFWLAKASVT